MKKLRFIGSSLDDLKNFPAEARREAGFELDAVQRGAMTMDFKTLLAVGLCAYEIRIHALGEWFRSPRSMTRYTYGTPFIRKHKKHGVKTLSCLHAVTDNWGTSMDKEPVIESSGNVFADLGFAPEEAALLAMRAELMARLRETIAERGWTQIQAAEHLGIGQSRVSDLMRGKWEKFSLDMLVTLATRAGRRVELTAV